MVAPAVVLIAADLIVAIVVVLAARGVIRRNPVAGIRTGRTRRSEAAWEAAHRAALVPSTVSAGVSLLLAIGAIVASGAPTAAVLLAFAVVAILAGAVWSIVVAERAAGGAA
jgi:uncharacterized membrane protein